MANDELARRIAAVLDARRVDQVVRLSGGASRETWRFVADGRPLILQRQRRGDRRDIGVEARLVVAASAAGVPVPELVATSSDPEPLGGAFMILSAIDGETIARRILRDEEFASARGALPTQLGAALAAVHRIDPSGIPLEDVDPLPRFRDLLDELGQPHPTFELAMRWLEAHRPASARRTVVHGDFRLGNVIVGAEGLRAVLDWELAHLGDPMEDLGWLCAKAWRFGGPHPVAGLGPYDELFSAYEEASGVAVDPEAVHWWEIMATFSWGVMCIVQTSSHLQGFARSHELAAIGRRVCETEYDLFQALEGRW